MGFFGHLIDLIGGLHHGGHRSRHHGGHHYDPHHDPHCDPNYDYQREPARKPVAARQPSAAPCPKCGRFNPSHVLFCQQCGFSLAGNGPNIACANCGMELAPDAHFCNQCGQPQL